MTARGHEPHCVRNDTKGDFTVRRVAFADYGVYIDTPTVTAITREDATDDETMRIIDDPTS